MGWKPSSQSGGEDITTINNFHYDGDGKNNNDDVGFFGNDCFDWSIDDDDDSFFKFGENSSSITTNMKWSCRNGDDDKNDSWVYFYPTTTTNFSSFPPAQLSSSFDNHNSDTTTEESDGFSSYKKWNQVSLSPTAISPRRWKKNQDNTKNISGDYCNRSATTKTKKTAASLIPRPRSLSPLPLSTPLSSSTKSTTTASTRRRSCSRRPKGRGRGERRRGGNDSKKKLSKSSRGKINTLQIISRGKTLGESEGKEDGRGNTATTIIPYSKSSTIGSENNSFSSLGESFHDYRTSEQELQQGERAVRGISDADNNKGVIGIGGSHRRHQQVGKRTGGNVCASPRANSINQRHQGRSKSNKTRSRSKCKSAVGGKEDATKQHQVSTRVGSSSSPSRSRKGNPSSIVKAKKGRERKKEIRILETKKLGDDDDQGQQLMAWLESMTKENRNTCGNSAHSNDSFDFLDNSGASTRSTPAVATVVGRCCSQHPNTMGTTAAAPNSRHATSHQKKKKISEEVYSNAASIPKRASSLTLPPTVRSKTPKRIPSRNNTRRRQNNTIEKKSSTSATASSAPTRRKKRVSLDETKLADCRMILTCNNEK